MPVKDNRKCKSSSCSIDSDDLQENEKCIGFEGSIRATFKVRVNHIL
jgi:hypothetical protein